MYNIIYNITLFCVAGDSGNVIYNLYYKMLYTMLCIILYIILYAI